jgi:hypothetical protein
MSNALYVNIVNCEKIYCEANYILYLSTMSTYLFPRHQPMRSSAILIKQYRTEKVLPSTNNSSCLRTDSNSAGPTRYRSTDAKRGSYATGNNRPPHGIPPDRAAGPRGLAKTRSFAEWSPHAIGPQFSSCARVMCIPRRPRFHRPMYTINRYPPITRIALSDFPQYSKVH